MSTQTLLEGQLEIPATQTLILDAAISCVKRWGIDRVTLNDIAKEARVARSTVYSYYSNRDQVIRFALLQSAYGFGERLFDYINQFQSPEERLIEAVIYALERLPSEPYLALISDTSLSQMVRNHSLTTPEGIDIGSALVKTILSDEHCSDEELQEMSEAAMRFMLSMLTMESPVDREEIQLRGFIARRLLPSLGLSVPAEYQVFERAR